MAKAILDKLGIKPGSNAVVIGRPESLAAVLPLEERDTAETPHETTIVFVADRNAMPRAIEATKHYRDGDRLWFAYPKKSGRLASDIDRDAGWDALTAMGFLGVTQIALDADWSALRFRRRGEIKTLTRKSELSKG